MKISKILSVFKHKRFVVRTNHIVLIKTSSYDEALCHYQKEKARLMQEWITSPTRLTLEERMKSNPVRVHAIVYFKLEEHSLIEGIDYE